MSHIISNCNKIQFTTVKYPHFFRFWKLKLKVMNQGGAVKQPPAGKKFEKNMKIGNMWIRWTYCVSFKFEIPVPTKSLSVVPQFSVIKCSKTGNVEVEFVGRSTFPHYLMYFELRNIHPNYALLNAYRLRCCKICNTSACDCQNWKWATKILEKASVV